MYTRKSALNKEEPLTTGRPDLRWELRASVAAVGFQGRIFPSYQRERSKMSV